MSHLDPYGDAGPLGWDRPDERQGRERPDGPPGWGRPDGGYGWDRPDERHGWDRPDGPPGWGRPDGGYGWDRPDERHGWERPEASPSWSRPDSGGETQTWRASAEEYSRHTSYEPVHPYHQGEPGRHHSHGPDDGSGGAVYGGGYVGPGGYRPDDSSYAGGGGGDDARYAGPVAEPDTAVWPLVGAEPVPPRRARGRRRAGRRRAAGKPAGSSRAGRNLPAAIGVGLALASVILVPLFLSRPAFVAVVAVAVSIGIWEMSRAVGARGAHPPVVPLIAGGLLMTGLAWRAGPDGLSLGLLVTVLATLVWRLADGPAGYQRDLTAATLIAVYVPFLAGFAVLLAVPSDGDWRVLATLAAVVLSDTGGYAVGVLIGRHRMAPSISPKKSWEGFAGSVGSAAIGSALLLNAVLGVELWWGALFGLAVSVAAVLGDLCESMIKRDLGIKDMSRLLPGHGGLMDRLDSILFAVPTAYLLLAIIAPVSQG